MLEFTKSKVQTKNAFLSDTETQTNLKFKLFIELSLPNDQVIFEA
jgi:hypothetical protein